MLADVDADVYVIVDVPDAMADRMRARCETDLSPGTSIVPVKGRLRRFLMGVIDMSTNL